MPISTKQALADSLQKLVVTKPLDKITIRDITEDCGVNRQTFYYHFQDIYDLIEWIFTTATDEIIHSSIASGNWQEGRAVFLNYLQQNRHLVLNVYNSINRPQLERFFKKWARPVITQALNQIYPDFNQLKTEHQNIIIDIYIWIMIGFIMEWLENDMDEKFLANLDYFSKFMESTISAAISSLIK